MQEEEFSLTGRELEKISVISSVVSCNIPQTKAAELLGLSVRQIYRLKKLFEQYGANGLRSKKRGQPSNRLISKDIKIKSTRLIAEKFYDYGPTLAAEKLREYHDIHVSKETTRKWMIDTKLWRAYQRKVPKIHLERDRRDCFGELIQMDGSTHPWFEDRGPSCTLLVFIDDATSNLTSLKFVEAETTLGYFDTLGEHLNHFGVPKSAYSDKHGVFKVNHPEAKSGNGLTQFGRALKGFGIEMIFASSPQAKGRVERVNRTLQDRLVKELRYHNICDIDSANKFLEKYIVKHNQRFGKRAKNQVDLHRSLTDSERKQLGITLSIQTQRTISKDMLVRYNSSIFRIIAPGQVRRLSQEKVVVCESISGKISILYNNQALQYEVYKKGLHFDQIFNRKDANNHLQKVRSLEKIWLPTKDVVHHCL